MAALPPPAAIARAEVAARVRAPARYSFARTERGIRVTVWPRPGSRAQPAVYLVRLRRDGARWRVVAVTGGPRICRQTRGGERDPDPGATMLSC